MVRANENALLKAGAVSAGMKAASSAPNQHSTKKSGRDYDEETDTVKATLITHDFKQALMAARTAKGLTQKDLANRINERPQVIAGYESGKEVPNGQVINKLNNILGVRLPTLKKVTSTAAAQA